MNSEEVYKSLIGKLSGMRRKEILSILAERFVLFLSFSFIVIYAVTLLESVLRFSAAERNVIFLLLLSAIIFLLIIFLTKPLKIFLGIDKSLSDERLARRVGFEFTEVKDRFLNAIQIYSNRESNKEGYSRELIDLYVRKTGKDLLERDFDSAVDIKFLLNRLRIFGVVLCVGLLMFGLFYGTFGGALKRVFQPKSEFPIDADFSILLEPGNVDLLRGEEVEIQIKVEGEKADRINLYIKEDGEEDFSDVELNKTDDGDYVYKVDRINSSFKYYAKGTDEVFFQRDITFMTDIYNIRVIYRPMIRKFKVRLDFPTYSGLGSRYLEDNIGDIAALVGTNVNFEVFANKELSEGKIVFENLEPVIMNLRNNIATAGFVVNEDDRYRLIIKDSEGITNESPIEYFVSTVLDRYPSVEIHDPGKDIDLEEGMKVPLYFKISDDFGFSLLRLVFRKNFPEGEFTADVDSIRNLKGFQYLELDIFKSSELTQNLIYEWDLSKSDMMPEDEIVYFIEVYDNDDVSGPKKGISRIYRIRFPSLAEIYSKVDELQDSSIDDMEEIFERNRELKEKIDEISLEIRKKLELSWEERKELKNVADEQSDLQEKLDDIEEKIEELIEKSEKNELASFETIKKYIELQKLINEISSPEFKKVMEELQKSLEEQINSPEMRNMVSKMKLSQDELLKKIDRTLNIMKQIRAEQKLDEVVKRAEDLLQRQKEVEKRIKNYDGLKEVDNKGLADDEERIKSSAEELREKMEDAAKNMSEDPLMPSRKINSSIDMFDRREIPKKMSGMAEELRENEMNRAGESGKVIEKDLTDLSESLKSAQKEMIGAQKEMIKNAMLKSAMNLLSLSQSEEELNEETRSLDRTSSRFPSIAEKQLDILSGLSRVGRELIDLSQKTFFVTPDMGRALAQAVLNMQNSIRELEERETNKVVSSQIKSLTALNLTVEEIRKSLESLEGAASASGLEEYLKRLEEMAGKQSGINEEASDLPMGIKPTVGDGERMLKLAREQEALRRALEELMNEMGESSQVLGDLEQINQDMENVSKDLENKMYERRTAQLMERIFSRLLDAQRSLQRQDYSRRRKSETAKDYRTLSPKELPSGLGEKDSDIREKLLKAISEGYSRDLIEIIRRYFLSLSEIYSED
ncbi:hypothetical protein ACFL4Z_01765 [candidate division KSB1 bacterium]